MKRQRALLFSLIVVLALCAACGWWLYRARWHYGRNRQLIDALVKGDTQQALVLVNAGADPNTPTEPPSAASLWRQLQNSFAPTSTSLRNSPTAFVLACWDNEQGKYDEAVYQAKALQRVALVQAMLAHGADTNAQGVLGGSALLAAVKSHYLPIAELLLKRGLSVNAQDGLGETALDYAAINKSDPMIRLLLANGAKPNVQDMQGNTALYYAVGFGNDVQMVQMLLEHAADPNLHDKQGNTYIQDAQQLKRSDLVRLLKQHGAK